MAATLPRPTVAPLTQAPLFARDAHELRSVLAAQTAEAESLKERLAARQRECAQLRQRARDAHGEVAVAHEATKNATERLGVHAERHGLVLAAGMERVSVERTHIEHDLQRVEALLHERDLEIARLRREAHELEATTHQNEMEIKGLTVATEAASSHARSLNMGVSELLKDLHGSAERKAGHRPLGASSREMQRATETSMALTSKREEAAGLKARAAAAAQEAQRLEAEQDSVRERVGAFERELRAKQEQMDAHDKQHLREGELLRMHCEELRHALHAEQRESVGIDQRAVLHPQSGTEAEGVKREAAALMSSVPRLASTLSSRGLGVVSPQVPGDRIDGQLHEVLQRASTLPSVVWRLSAGEYLIGSTRVTVLDGPHGLLAHDPRTGSVLLNEYLLQQAHGGHRNF